MNKLLKGVTSALTLTAMVIGPAVVVTVVSTTAAFAEKGGNGQSNGNARSERSNNGNANRHVNNNSGRGSIASELKGLNAAHANQNALMNASPSSMPGKLFEFQQASLAAAQIEAQVNEKADLYAALQNMTEERFYELNPDLDYASTLATAGADYQASMEEQANATANAEQALAILTDGRILSEAAMAELRQMLDL